MVDKNVPWRIVADIGSPTMMKYAAKYKIYGTTHLLTTAYTYAHNINFNNFKYIDLHFCLSKPFKIKKKKC